MEKQIHFFDFTNGTELAIWIEANRYHLSYDLLVSELILNLKDLKVIKPFHIAPLACVINEYKDAGILVTVLYPLRNSVRNFLESFGFFDFVNQRDYERSQSFRPTSSGLIKVNSRIAESHPMEVVEYFQRNHFSGKSLSSLGISLGELLNNICDHSETDQAFTFTQHFPKKKSIICCVCDLGKGIPKKVQEYQNKIGGVTKSELDSLKFALQVNNSTKSTPRNSGKGLDNVLNNVNSLSGKIQIFTNKVVYLAKFSNNINSETFEEHRANFPGTLVVIYLDTNNLPVQEYEEVFFG